MGDVVGTVNPPSTEATQQQILAALSPIPAGSLTVTANMHDGAGNALTSQLNGVQQALDIGIDVLGVQIDPRDRNWVLASPGDSVAATQSGTWTTDRSWVLDSSSDSVSAVQSGTWTVGRSWFLSSGSDSVSASISNFPAVQPVSQDSPPWTMDLVSLNGSSFSQTNYLPTRITNGTSYVDPTQIRLLTSTDVVTANQGGSWTVTANAGTGTFQTNVTNSTLAVTQSGTWTTGRTWTLSSGTDSVAVTGTITATNSANGNTGAPVPAQATQVGGSDGTNLQALKVSTAGVLSVDGSATTQPISGTVTANQGGTWTVQQGTPPWTVSQSGAWSTRTLDGSGTGITSTAAALDINIKSGSAGRTWVLSSGTDSVSAAQSGSWTVTANAGTNLNTSLLALDTSVTGLQVSQGSTTSGQKGDLIQAAVTASSPLYTTGQTFPLSLTTSGALRVDATATTQPINVSQVGGFATNLGNGIVGAGTQRVVIASDQTAYSVNAIQSGTWNINNVSGTVSLPTGASTSANQTNGSQKTQVVDGSGNVYGPTTTLSAVNYLPVVQASSGTPGAAVPARSTVVAGSDGTNVQTIATDTSGRVKTDMTTIAGTATSTGNGTTGAGSQRVTIASDNTAFTVNAAQSGNWSVRLQDGSGNSIGSTSISSVNFLNVTAEGNVASGATDSGNPTKVGGVYNSTMPTLTNGQRGDMQMNARGELAIRRRNKFVNYTGNATNTVKSGAGILAAICFNNGGNSSTLTLYDNTAASGTKLATIAFASSTWGFCAIWDAEFSTGLTVVTAGSASNDVTILYQ